MLKFKFDAKNNRYVANRETVVGEFNGTFNKENIFALCDNTLYRGMKLDHINKKALAQKTTDLFSMGEISFEDYEKVEKAFDVVNAKLRLFDKLIEAGKVSISVDSVNDFEKGLAYGVYPRLFPSDKQTYPEWWEPCYLSFKRFILKRANAEKESKETQKGFQELKDVLCMLANEAGLSIQKVTAKEANAFFDTLAEKLNVNSSKEGRRVTVDGMGCQEAFNAFCMWLFYYGHNAK